MAPSSEVSRRREAIRRLLIENDPPIEDQKGLLKRLREMGIFATQSSISRDLTALGAVRVPGHYAMISWLEGESPLRDIQPLVVKAVRLADHQILVVTQPGAGVVVAEAMEAQLKDFLVGTLAGYASVLLFSGNVVFQDTVWQLLGDYLDAVSRERTEKRDGGG